MADDDPNDESILIELRSPAVVAQRCIILASILQRHGIDVDDRGDPYGAVFDLREWLRAENLWTECTAAEKVFFLRPPDARAPDDVASIVSTTEQLMTIAWALGSVSSLASGPSAELRSVLQDTPGPWAKTEPWNSSRSLRSEAEIVIMREFNDIWVWRFDVEPYRRSTQGRELMQLERAIRDVTRDAVSTGLLAAGKRGGFTIDGVPVEVMAPDEIDELQLIAEERLVTLNWICGFGDDWDSAPLDV